MQEEEEKDMAAMSIEEQFAFSQESFEEASARAIEESRSFNKAEYFRMDKIGTYALRFMPIAPNADGSPLERKSYEYPVHQMILEIFPPAKAGKSKSVYVPVTRATYAGFSLDVVDTFKKVAVEAAKAADDDDLADKIAGGGFNGGLKYNFGHAAYVFDMDERAKGLQIITLSHSQYKTLEESKLKIWKKKCVKSPKHPCVISSISNAYPVEIEKKKEGKKTSYVISIDNESDYDVLTKEELTTLINAPRIPEVIYRYSRYQFEATLEFLKQFDEKLGTKTFDSEEVQAAIKQLESELPKDDTSSFSFDKKKDGDKSEGEKGNSPITFDELLDMFDNLSAKKLGDKSEEGAELRVLIREFVEQEKLGVRITRTTTNVSALDMIEEALGGDKTTAPEPKPEADPEPKQAPEPEPEEAPEPEEENEPEPAARPDRRASRASRTGR